MSLNLTIGDSNLDSSLINIGDPTQQKLERITLKTYQYTPLATIVICFLVNISFSEKI